MAVADKMVELGLTGVGYEYLNIDDCWSVGREPNGTLIPDPTAFPNGMKAVADYVHSKVIFIFACKFLLDRRHRTRRDSSLASTLIAAI